MERGAGGGRGKAAEPHPVTCSSLAGRQAGKALVWLSFINLTACAKAPVLELIKQAPSHTPQSCGSPRDSCGGARYYTSAGAPHTHLQTDIHTHTQTHPRCTCTNSYTLPDTLPGSAKPIGSVFLLEFNLTRVDHQPFDVWEVCPIL